MPIIISIDGNIGAGKTTLFKLLKDKFTVRQNFIFLEEPVSVWQSIQDESGRSLLELFYEDSSSWGFSFQIAAFISRLAILQETLRNNPNAIIITERSLNTDRYVFAKMLYEQNKINSIDYQIYLKWFDTFTKDYPVSKLIYVKTDPVVCYKRIKERARQGENIIPLEYLESCHGYHENMINIFERTNVTFINGNIDITTNPEAIRSWIENIETALYEYMHL
uniref:Deoxynucleoside kinase domain-containing protein n=1 Tax=viral metagenome TaxID=1070528 RepID=A0A6C0KYF8_9ZZZZ